MNRIAAASGLAVAAIMASPTLAADMPYRERTHVYERPVPRVYYQSARPTAVCRTVFVPEARGRQWPKEQRSVARCTSFE